MMLLFQDQTLPNVKAQGFWFMFGWHAGSKKREDSNTSQGGSGTRVKSVQNHVKPNKSQGSGVFSHFDCQCFLWYVMLCFRLLQRQQPQVCLCRIWQGGTPLYCSFPPLQLTKITACVLGCLSTKTRISHLKLVYCKNNLPQVKPFLNVCCTKCISVLFLQIIHIKIINNNIIIRLRLIKHNT